MYDNPERIQYTFGLVDFGASNSTQTIPVPVRGSQGRAGRVVGVIISDVAEDFAGSTSDAGVQVGDGSDADKYFDTGLVLDETVDVADNATLWLEDDGAQVDIELGRSTLTVTFVAAVGTPTGQSDVTVVVDWF
jgi:hypothetical protein